MKDELAQWTALIKRMDLADAKADERWENRHPDFGPNIEYVQARVQCDRIELTRKKVTSNHE